jgi:hypothetical protein
MRVDVGEVAGDLSRRGFDEPTSQRQLGPTRNDERALRPEFLKHPGKSSPAAAAAKQDTP